jgi:hypothetical protein
MSIREKVNQGKDVVSITWTCGCTLTIRKSGVLRYINGSIPPCPVKHNY